MDLRELTALTRDAYIPYLVDQVFTATPLFARLKAKNQIVLDSGLTIRQPFVSDKLVSGSYSYMDTFDISYKKTNDYLQFDWKGSWVNLTLDNWSQALNEGTEGIASLVESKMQNLELTLVDMLDSWVCADPSDTKAFDGLWNGIDDGNTYATYGGITRTAGFTYGAVGNESLNSYVDTAGGLITPDRLRRAMGQATVGNKMPDLILTTQKIYDQLWARIITQWRTLSSKHADLVSYGFTGIEFDGAAVMVDTHVPSGFMYGINTNYVKLIMNRHRNFYLRDWQEPINADARVSQMLAQGNLIVQAPRLCFRISGLTEN